MPKTQEGFKIIDAIARATELGVLEKDLIQFGSWIAVDDLMLVLELQHLRL